MSNNTTNDSYISAQQLHLRWGVHIESVRRMIREGKLPAIRVGPRRLRISVADIEAYEASNRVNRGKGVAAL